jgi:hypothetical protein
VPIRDIVGALLRRSQHRKFHLSALFNFGRPGDMNKAIGIAVAKGRLFEMIDRIELARQLSLSATERW